MFGAAAVVRALWKPSESDASIETTLTAFAAVKYEAASVLASPTQIGLEVRIALLALEPSKTTTCFV